MMKRKKYLCEVKKLKIKIKPKLSGAANSMEIYG